jgi:branched-chain amino acid transport system substrate-binding protein
MSAFPNRPISRRMLALVLTAGLALPASARAEDGKLTIGLILPMSGTYADVGQQYQKGIEVFQALHGKSVAGLNVETITRDDQGPGSGDLARRLTQELIARDKADVILGYSFTPNAMSAASLLTQAKKPAVIINAATSVITEKSPYFVRVSFTTPQFAAVLGSWAAKSGIKTVYTIVSDYAPGIDAETWFKKTFTAGGGTIIGSARTAVSEMEYAPYLQRAAEAKPDAVFSFNPGGDVAVAFMKQAKERGLTASGIKLLVTGDLVEDNELPLMGDAIDGVISAGHYQIGLDNPANIAFVKKYKELYGADAIPNFRTVQGYDGMALIYAAAEKAKSTDGDALLAAMKGQKLDSPRGPVMIDPETRDIVQNIYIRKGEKKDGQWQNVAIETIPDVKDPAKEAAKEAAPAAK